MPRPKNPFYSIASLRGLETLYAQMHNISPKLPRGQYVDEIQKALHSDYVGVGGKSRNFVLKFLSEPDTEIDKVSGLDLEIVDEIVKKVYKETDLNKFFDIDIDTVESASTFFEEKIFAAPAHLTALDRNFLYYIYLSEDDQKSIDEFVKRRMYELGKITEGITTYNVYQWDKETKSAKCAILALNSEKKTAWYYYFASGAKGVRPTVLREERYNHGANTLSLDMVNENAKRKHIRVNFMLTVIDPSFSDKRTLKGALLATADNGTKVVSADCVLEHRDSYFAAEDRVTNKSSMEPLFSLEILNKKYEVDNANLYDIQRLESYPLYKLLEEIQGYYLIQYITSQGAKKGDGRLQKGICHIGLNGLVSFKYPELAVIPGYIDQQIYRGNKFVKINYFISQPNDPLDTEYKLEVYRNHELGGIVEYLFGVYSSIYLDTLYKGSYVFQKLPVDRSTGKSPYDDIEHAYTSNIAKGEESIKIDIDPKSKKIITQLAIRDKTAFDLLTSGRYDHEFRYSFAKLNNENPEA